MKSFEKSKEELDKASRNLTAWIVFLALLTALIVGFAASVPRDAINNGLLQSTMDGGAQCITNLGCLSVGNITASNAFIQNLTASNATIINLIVTNIINAGGPVYGGNAVAIEDSFIMVPTSLAMPSNTYLIDFGQTNGLGNRLIYAELTATNDVHISGTTNGFMNATLSFYVYCPGAVTRTITWPTNLFDTTNGTMLVTTADGVSVIGSSYALSCPSNEWVRFSVRSNHAGLEPQWQSKP